MKEFIILAKSFRGSDSVDILSATKVTEGYLLAVKYSWEDGSYREEALGIIEDMYGPKTGELYVGWSHVIYEHDAPEPQMRE